MNQSATFHSPAKVNLTLDVLGRDPSGYHRIQTIYQEVPALFDELTFEVLEQPKIELICDHPDVPIGEGNTIIKAAKILQQHAQKHTNQSPAQPVTAPKGARITLKKNIPSQAGLGGASSNMATTLKALNELWKLELPLETLLNYGKKISMDGAFFLIGGTMLGMHYGEHLMPLLPLKGYEIEILETDILIPTKEAYKTLNLEKCGQRQKDTSQFIQILNGNGEGSIEPLLHNDFEINFFEKHPELKEKHPDAHLAGSGGCLFKINAVPPLPASK